MSPKNQPQITSAETQPRQHEPERDTVIGGNWYLARCLKFPHLGYYMGLDALYLMYLIEGDPSHAMLIPRPFLWNFGRKTIIPTLYTSGTLGRRLYMIADKEVESPPLLTAVTQYLDLQDIQLETVTTESILTRGQEARNWHVVVNALLAAKTIETGHAERKIWDVCLSSEEDLTIGRFVDAGDRDGTYIAEIALLRLIYRHKLHIDFTQNPIDYSSSISPCI